MSSRRHSGGSAMLAGRPVARIGYGAMQLPGPGVLGPPRDRAAALAVLRRAVELGVNHMDTAQYYGPDVANELIHAALHPYPDDLVLVTKVGADRDRQGRWIPAQRPHELRAGVEANLRSLEVERIDVVNLRLLGAEQERGSRAAVGVRWSGESDRAPYGSGRRRGSGSHTRSGRPGLAPGSRPAHPADPRHLKREASGGERGRSGRPARRRHDGGTGRSRDGARPALTTQAC